MRNILPMWVTKDFGSLYSLRAPSWKSDLNLTCKDTTRKSRMKKNLRIQENFLGNENWKINTFPVFQKKTSDRYTLRFVQCCQMKNKIKIPCIWGKNSLLMIFMWSRIFFCDFYSRWFSQRDSALDVHTRYHRPLMYFQCLSDRGLLRDILQFF